MARGRARASATASRGNSRPSASPSQTTRQADTLAVGLKTLCISSSSSTEIVVVSSSYSKAKVNRYLFFFLPSHAVEFELCQMSCACLHRHLFLSIPFSSLFSPITTVYPVPILSLAFNSHDVRLRHSMCVAASHHQFVQVNNRQSVAVVSKSQNFPQPAFL